MKKFLKYGWENITLKKDHDRVESFLYLLMYGYLSWCLLFITLMMIFDGNKHALGMIWQPTLAFILMFTLFIISVTNYQLRFKVKSDQ